MFSLPSLQRTAGRSFRDLAGFEWNWEGAVLPCPDPGRRFAGSAAHRVLYFWHSVGNRVLTTLSNMTTNLNLTDMETCYKAFRLDVVRRLDLEEPRFGVEPEITAKVARLGVVVYEVGIGYDGRTYADGKKIGWRDGVHALFCIAAYSATGERLRLKRWSPALARALHRRS